MRPYGKIHLAAVAEHIAEKWGVAAPFPPAKVTDKWLKWKVRHERHEVLKQDLECDKKYYPSAAKETERSNAQYIKKTESMKPPEPYLSWAHIADFHEQAKDGAFYKQLLARADMSPRAKFNVGELFKHRLEE